MVSNRTDGASFSRLLGMGSMLLVFEFPNEISFSNSVSKMLASFLTMTMTMTTSLFSDMSVHIT